MNHVLAARGCECGASKYCVLYFSSMPLGRFAGPCTSSLVPVIKVGMMPRHAGMMPVLTWLQPRYPWHDGVFCLNSALMRLSLLWRACTLPARFTGFSIADHHIQRHTSKGPTVTTALFKNLTHAPSNRFTHTAARTHAPCTVHHHPLRTHSPHRRTHDLLMHCHKRS